MCMKSRRKSEWTAKKMKYNREMQLYAKKKRTQKKNNPSNGANDKYLSCSFNSTCRGFQKSNRENEGDENEIQ